MEITATRSGGFAGVAEQLGPIDGSWIPAELRGEIEQELERLDFYDLPGDSPPHDPIRDGFGYTIAVADGDRSNRVAFDDAEPRGLFRLLSLIEKTGAGWHSATMELQAERKAKWLRGGAWYNRMPGIDDPRLHVAGTCRVRSSAVELSLEPGNPGPVPEPGVVVLRLSASSADAGDDQVVEREVGWSEDVGPDVEWVRIIGEVSVSLEVTIAV